MTLGLRKLIAFGASLLVVTGLAWTGHLTDTAGDAITWLLVAFTGGNVLSRIAPQVPKKGGKARD